ncbi:hypothetical protein FPV67DRAFT_1665205 [Lyophyllum atratum]|nr:hypothetical protein FPV67DRAFT_1665205 [Lyophyllum atratum]
MNQDWHRPDIAVGRGGTGGGGRGGDVGSNNTTTTTHTNSHNDSSIRQRLHGDYYTAPVDQGDKFSGDFKNSAVGGRRNNNTLNNGASSERGERKQSPAEIALNQRLERAREKLAAKKERERLAQLEAEIQRLEAELSD